MTTSIRILCIGDVMGNAGCAILQHKIDQIKKDYNIDAIIVNGENAAKNGKGLVAKNIEFFKSLGVNVITTGNHVYEHRDVFALLNQRDDVIRPANFPPGCPGKGIAFFQVNNYTVAVINLHGRVFIREPLDCPFRTVESLLTFVKTKANIIFVDFHAEATAEKRAMSFFLDGKVSGMVGTHTHIQTADEYVMPQGMAYITDLGSCGALNSVIGMQQELVLQRFIFHPFMGKFVVDTQGPLMLNGAVIQVDSHTGKAEKIERIYIVDENITVAADSEPTKK